MEEEIKEKAKEFLLKLGFDDAHLPNIFNEDDKSYYTVPELMEAYYRDMTGGMPCNCDNAFFLNKK